MKKSNHVAMLTIKSPGKMTRRERRAIAAWLRQHAEAIMKYGDEYTDGRFIGRYMAK